MEVTLHRLFLKKFKKVPKPIRSKFVERKNLFLQDRFNPVLNNHSVEKAFPGCRSINVTGDYRAILKEQDGEVIFIRIGTHPELYG